MTKNNYTGIEIVNLVSKHADKKHFDADLKLYKKYFADRRALKTFEQKFEPMLKQYDERMVHELLIDARLPIEAILENRGVKPESKKETSNPDKAGNEYQKALDQLKETDIENAKYNELKKLVFALNIDVADNKGDTYKAALLELKEQSEPEARGDNPEASSDDDPFKNEDSDKKKDGQN